MPGKSHGPRSLVGYNPLGQKESDTTERRVCVCVALSTGELLRVVRKSPVEVETLSFCFHPLKWALQILFL